MVVSWGLDSQSSALDNLGTVARQRGDPSRAAECYRQSLSIMWAQNDLRNIADALTGLALTRLADGQVEPATRFLGAARASSERAGMWVSYEGGTVQRALDDARAQLGARSFHAALRAGASTPLDETISEALAAGTAIS